jgi:lipoprotein NlpI
LDLRRLTNRRGRQALAVVTLALLTACNTPSKKQETTPYEITLAAAAMEGQDYDQAARQWTAALDMQTLTDEQRARSLWGRAAAYSKTGNFDGAMDDANAALKLKPDWPELFRLRGALYLHRRDYAHALDDFDAAIRLKADSAEAHSARAEVRLLQGNGDAAITDLDLAISLKPYLSILYTARGTAYLQTGKTSQAMADFDEAIRRAPKDFAGYYGRWLADYKLGRLSAGIADLQTILSLQPNKPYVVLQLHLAHLREKTPDQPEFLANAAKLELDKWPGSIVLFYQGKTRQDEVFAAAASAEAAKHLGQICEADYYVGEYLVTTRKQDEGRRLLAAARDNCPADMDEYLLARLSLEK